MVIQSIRFLIFSFLLSALILGCGAGSQKNIQAENNNNQNSKVQSQDDNWQQVLAGKNPLEKDELYTTVSGQEHSVFQGVQQPYEISVVT